MIRKRMVLIALVLGALMVFGCAISKETRMAYNDAKDTFQKATAAGAKKCAPCQYAMAEAYLALADHEADHFWREIERLDTHIKIVKEKSLEALKLTPCEAPPKPPAPTPGPPRPPTPLAPTPPGPPAPSPVPKPAPPAPKAPLVFDPAYFDMNKTNISPTSAKALDRNGMILRENPQIRVEIGGHTDSGGSEKANRRISEKRAQSAKKYLMDKFGIADNRLIVKGYGSSRPIADNKTQEGRAKNRRVEFRILP